MITAIAKSSPIEMPKLLPFAAMFKLAQAAGCHQVQTVISTAWAQRRCANEHGTHHIRPPAVQVAHDLNLHEVTERTCEESTR